MTSPFSVESGSNRETEAYIIYMKLLEKSGNARFKFSNLQNCPPKNIKRQISGWYNVEFLKPHLSQTFNLISDVGSTKKDLQQPNPQITRFPYTQST